MSPHARRDLDVDLNMNTALDLSARGFCTQRKARMVQSARGSFASLPTGVADHRWNRACFSSAPDTVATTDEIPSL